VIYPLDEFWAATAGIVFPFVMSYDVVVSRSYQHTNTAVFLLHYHFVFCPKRRRKVLTGKLRDRLEVLLKTKTKELGWEIIALEIMPDHFQVEKSESCTANQLRDFST
jgi:hypothetical protein